MGRLLKVVKGRADPTNQDKDLERYAEGHQSGSPRPKAISTVAHPAGRKKGKKGGRWGKKKGKNCRRRITPRLVPKSIRDKLRGKSPLPKPGTLPPPVLPPSDEKKTKLNVFKMAQRIRQDGGPQKTS